MKQCCTGGRMEHKVPPAGYTRNLHPMVSNIQHTYSLSALRARLSQLEQTFSSLSTTYHSKIVNGSPVAETDRIAHEICSIMKEIGEIRPLLQEHG